MPQLHPRKPRFVDAERRIRVEPLRELLRRYSLIRAVERAHEAAFDRYLTGEDETGHQEALEDAWLQRENVRGG